MLSLTLVCSLGGAATAQAQVSGSVQDPRGDVDNSGVHGGMPLGSMRDIRSFAVAYEAESGRLEATIRFWDPGTEAYPWFTVRADVGVYRNGGCDAAATGGVLLSFRTPFDAPDPEAYGPWARIIGEPGETRGWYASAGDGWTYAVQSKQLMRRGYDCVARLRLDHDSGGVERTADFCMSPRGTVDCSRPPAPPSGLRVVASGDGHVTLDWDDSRDLRPGDRYQVYVGDRAVHLSVASSTFTVGGLRNGDTYRFRVSAGQPGSYGDWTAPVTGTPRPAPQDPGGGGGTGSEGSGGGTTTGGGSPPDGPAPPEVRGDTDSGGPTDSSAPVTLRVRARRIRTFARTGLTLRVTCIESCALISRVTVSKRTARRLQSRPVLARRAVRLRPPGAVTIKLRPSARIARRLLRLNRLHATVTVRSVGEDGTVRWRDRRIVLVA